MKDTKCHNNGNGDHQKGKERIVTNEQEMVMEIKNEQKACHRDYHHQS
jgi:hypothetical protein